MSNSPYKRDDKYNPETLPLPLAYTAPTAGPATRQRKRKEAPLDQEIANGRSGHKAEAASQTRADEEAEAKAEAVHKQMGGPRHIQFTESTDLQHSKPEPRHVSPMVKRTRVGRRPETRSRPHYKDPEYWYGPRISRKSEEDQDADSAGT